METTVCSCGFVCDAGWRFCQNCGAPLSGSTAAVPDAPGRVGKVPLSTDEKKPINIYPDDSDLKMLADCCDKTCALPTGDRYRESVLYSDEKSGGYQLHRYESDGSGSETHDGYEIGKEQADAILSSIDEDILRDADKQPDAVCGSIRVIKYRNDRDDVVRVECHTQEAKALSSVIQRRMADAVRAGRRIVPDYAKSWKICEIHMAGMSMDDCYDIVLERNDGGNARAKGNLFINGTNHVFTEWVTLSEEETKKLADIPLGLLRSCRTETSPDAIVPGNMIGIGMAGNAPCGAMGSMMMAGMMMSGAMGNIMMSDAGRFSCTVTYGDDRTDDKIKDMNILGELKPLLNTVFSRVPR